MFNDEILNTMTKKTIANILVPTDFSECAANALEAAISVAKVHNARITLLHVVSPIPEFYGLQKDRIVKEQQQELLDSQSDRIMKLGNSLQENHGLSVVPIIVVGQTVATVLETAKALDVDLIVMGTHGIKGFREFLIGSNTYGVTEKSASPVLSIPQSSITNGFEKIMFPVRNIPNALEKYEFLKTFVATGNASLFIYGIYKIDDEHLMEAYKKVSAFVKGIENDWLSIKLTSVITEESLADEALEQAAQMKCDLIVITSKVTSSFNDFFLGKFAQQVINHSIMPVLHIK
ncbi:universal stress protein [Pedobacter sp. V48]|uniref:universal stress protein n=1 Tax=Pedobacter sp. V48 TaxID=509635 RepID=UPI0003E4E03E|nr:universal stress protein [Pedobacter sp. V48]ETZ19575.1 hypothetical protein N824_12600 [Pedobacter sp. V48]